MSKLLTTLIAGLFAVSVFAADAPKPANAPAEAKTVAAAKAEVKESKTELKDAKGDLKEAKTEAKAEKKAHKHHKKEKAEAAAPMK